MGPWDKPLKWATMLANFCIPRAGMIFLSLEVAWFFLSWEVPWFFSRPERLSDFFCPERLQDFFAPWGCVSFLSWEVAWFCLSREVASKSLVLSDLELQTQMDRWESLLWMAWKYWNGSYWCGGVDKFFVECYVVEIFGIQGLKKESKNVLKLWKKIPPIPNPQSPIWYPLLGILSPIGINIPNWGFGLLVLY